jgi:hypothetical protein
MAVVADDLAFFRHHPVAALGAGVKKLFRFVVIGALFHFLAEIKKRGEAFDHGGFLSQVFIHKASLARLFPALNGLI